MINVMNNNKCSGKLMKNCTTGNSTKSPYYDKKIDFLTNHNISSIHSNSCYFANSSVNYGYGGNNNPKSSGNVTLSPNSKTLKIKKQLIGSQIQLYYPNQHNKKVKIRTMSQGNINTCSKQYSKDNSVNRNKSQSQLNQKLNDTSSMKLLPSCGNLKVYETYKGRLKLLEAVLKELVSKNNTKINEEIEAIYNRIMKPGLHSKSVIDLQSQIQNKPVGKQIEDITATIAMNPKFKKINKENEDLKALYLNKKIKNGNGNSNKIQNNLNEFKALFSKYNKKKPIKQQLKKNNITATSSTHNIFKNSNIFIPTEITHHNHHQKNNNDNNTTTNTNNNHRNHSKEIFNDKETELLQEDTMDLMSKYDIEDTKQLLYYQPKVKVRKHLKTSNMPKLKLNITDLRLDHHHYHYKPNGMPLNFADSLNSINDKIPKDEIEAIFDDGTLNEGFLMESDTIPNQFSQSIISFSHKKVTNE